MAGITISVSNDKLSNPQQFIEEVNEAFKSTMPPIGFEIAQGEDVAVFAKVFNSAEHSYRGKRISCKNAKSFAPLTYAAVEIYTIERDKFPIVLFFKSILDIEDFAEGYLRAIETTPPPTDSYIEPVSVQEAAETEPVESVTSPRKAKRKRGRYYEVNPFAEALLDTMLKITLAVGWTMAIATIVASIFIAIDMDAYYIIFLGILAAAFLLLLYYSSWAIYKVIINISRNLFNINERLTDCE